jgi:hypothetical protein
VATSLLATADRPVINEILYNPVNSAEALEYIELYNPTDRAISLSNWTLSDGIDYLFPATAVIPAKGYVIVAQNPGWVRSRFGTSAFGPWEGKLSNEGDGIRLRDHQAGLVDSVEYGGAFPWPTVGDAPERSISLLNAGEDNALPGNWRSRPPTPGAANNGIAGNPPPSVQSVAHQPQSPQSGSSVQIVATATDTSGIASATLLLQVVEPGAYIPLNDPLYASTWTPVPMQVGTDGKLSATVPAWARGHRKLVRYRIAVTDKAGATVMVPYGDDPQPNFAFYIYDAQPAWFAAIKRERLAVCVAMTFLPCASCQPISCWRARAMSPTRSIFPTRRPPPTGGMITRGVARSSTTASFTITLASGRAAVYFAMRSARITGNLTFCAAMASVHWTIGDGPMVSRGLR